MKKLEIYIHIPFCIKKCNYCDFLSIEADKEYQETYYKALQKEIANTHISKEYVVSSIFIGGGTPSVISANWIADIMERLKSRFSFREDIEISIECNPGTVDKEKLELYRMSGINRISFGLQSCHDEELKLLGRIHNYKTFLESYEMARDAGFGNVNVDMMSGLPGQTAEDWERSLRQIAELGPEHVSAYSLIIEEGTPFARQQLELPEEETERLMYEQTYEILKGYGYKQYEISNYAKEGFPCKHNIGYWKRVEYLGLGLGAASLLEDVRWTNSRDMEDYIALSSTPEQIRCDIEILDRQAKMEEYLFLGMRMLEGVTLEGFYKQFSEALPAVYGDGIKKMAAQGLVHLEQGVLRLTRAGISLSNYVFSEILISDSI